jgi:hypothetical protein
MEYLRHLTLIGAPPDVKASSRSGFIDGDQQRFVPQL